MKLLIAIPSKNRIETLKDNAFKWVKNIDVPYRIFVEPQDYDAYDEVFPNVHVMGENDKGLGYAKQQIRDYAVAHGYTHVFKMDDDVRGFTDYRRRLADDEVPQFISKLIGILQEAFEKDERIKAVSFNYSFEMYERKVWEVTKRVQTAYVVATEYLTVNPLISVYEDFAVGLKIIADGGLVMRYGLAGINMGVKVGGGTGGHQSFDRFEQAKKELDLLRKIYPPLNFRRVNKAWKIEPDLSSVVIPKRSTPS